MDLKKTITTPRIDYVGVGNFELSAGSKLLMRKKNPNTGWENFLEREVPESKNWKIVISVSIDETDV